MRLVRSCSLLALLLLGACRQDIPQSPATVAVSTPTVTVLRGGRLIDGTGQPVVEDATLVVSEGKVLAIGPSSRIPVPVGATVQDLAGRTVVPGLIALQPALAAEFADPAWRSKTLANAKQIATEEQALAVNERNLKALADAGVSIGFGTDSGATPLRVPGFAEHRELALMVAAGLSPLQAITVATSGAAGLLHLEDRGTLTPGKRADFIVVDGKPDVTITDIDRIVAVWQRGLPVAKTVTDFTP